MFPNQKEKLVPFFEYKIIPVECSPIMRVCPTKEVTHPKRKCDPFP